MSPRFLFLSLLCFLLSFHSFAQHTDVVDISLSSWKFSEAGKNDWKTAEVPGNIHRDLLNNNLISDPTLKDNEKKCRWVEKKDWEYTTPILLDSLTFLSYRHSCVELVFESLDTYVDVFLNDSLILKSNNMFRSYSVRVEKILRPGNNQIRVLFHNDAPAEVLKSTIPFFRYPAANDSTSPYTRKSPLQYGWDFAPRMITCGIRKRAHLRIWKDFMVRDLHIIQKALSTTSALMVADATIESEIDDSVTCILGMEKISKRILLKKGINHCLLPFYISHPILWWPSGMGEQHLYETQLHVHGPNSSCSVTASYGLRTIEVNTQPDAYGQSFYLTINGQPMYVKGANLVPKPLLNKNDNPDADLLNSLTECGINLVRIWGGGLYGDDDFFRSADQNGILVWEDFMFAGTMYPGDEAFLNNVEKEAEDNIIRLRNHPSLALWCGNNEIEVGWKNWGWEKEFHYSKADSMRLMKDYTRLFDELLPAKVSSLDSGRYYFSSTPMSNWGKADDLKKGDNHYWAVWHGEKPFDDYNTHPARFVSEFGFESFPEIQSIRKFTSLSGGEPGPNVLKDYQFCTKGNRIIGKYMELYYRKPKDFESYIYLTQLLQGEATKTAIEAQRRNKPYCMGSVFWQFNDYWPSASWSAIDYFGSEKAAFFQLKKAYQPILVSPVLENGELSIYTINDKQEALKAQLYVLVSDLKGERKTEFRQNVELKTKAAERVFSRKQSLLLEDHLNTNCFIYTALISGKDTLSENVLCVVPPKELMLEDPGLTWDLKKDDDHFSLKIRSKYFAKNVFISSTGNEGPYPGDNSFDLIPGKEKILILYSDQTFEKLKQSLKIVSLRDSYTE